MTKTSFKPGDMVRLVSEPRIARLERLVGQPSIITRIDENFTPPRLIVAVFDPHKNDVERIRCRTEDVEMIRAR